jgi:hypothetical protein
VGFGVKEVMSPLDHKNIQTRNKSTEFSFNKTAVILSSWNKISDNSQLSDS